MGHQSHFCQDEIIRLGRLEDTSATYSRFSKNAIRQRIGRFTTANRYGRFPYRIRGESTSAPTAGGKSLVAFRHNKCYDTAIGQLAGNVKDPQSAARKS